MKHLVKSRCFQNDFTNPNINMVAFIKCYLKGFSWWSGGCDSILSIQGTWVLSLVGDLKPTCYDQGSNIQPRRSKILHAAAGTRCSQINEYIYFKKKKKKAAQRNNHKKKVLVFSRIVEDIDYDVTQPSLYRVLE